MVTRRSDAGVSRISTLFTLVGVLIVSSVVSLVLVTADDDSTSGTRAAAAPRVSTNAPDSATPAPTTTAALSTASSSAPSAAPSESTSPVAKTSVVPKSGGTTGETPATRGPITYTVRKGDNLTVIAAWFKLHGYGDLYDANRKTIGADPNLIRPGQRITVSSAGMSVSR